MRTRSDGLERSDLNLVCLWRALAWEISDKLMNLDVDVQGCEARVGRFALDLPRHGTADRLYKVLLLVRIHKSAKIPICQCIDAAIAVAADKWKTRGRSFEKHNT